MTLEMHHSSAPHLLYHSLSVKLFCSLSLSQVKQKKTETVQRSSLWFFNKLSFICQCNTGNSVGLGALLWRNRSELTAWQTNKKENIV